MRNKCFVIPNIESPCNREDDVQYDRYQDESILVSMVGPFARYRSFLLELQCLFGITMCVTERLISSKAVGHSEKEFGEVVKWRRGKALLITP